MKLFALAAAALVAMTGLAPAALTSEASAQRTVVTERTVVHTTRHGGPGYRNGRAYHGNRSYRGRRYVRTRRVCRNEWRNHRRVRICRTVRR